MTELSGGTCPTQGDLQRMVLGKLPDVDTERIHRHLDQCVKCVAALEQCVASDAILEAVRSSGSIGAEQTKTLYRSLVWLRAVDPTRHQAQDSTLCGHKVVPVLAAEVCNLLSPTPSPDAIGRIGDFCVFRVLGTGGMGVVFEAEDIRLKRRVALKVMHPAISATPMAGERFLREAQSAAALKHEHVVTIYQVGTHGETPFAALELLHGETLQSCLARNGRLSVPEVIRIGREIAMGLAAAHARGLLHRDIKPANIWLEGPDPSPREPPGNDFNPRSNSATASPQESRAADGTCSLGKVKILDFGLAKSWKDDSGNSHPGLLIGTPAYMAPEHLAENTVDPRSDLFSLGCVMYRMVCGKPPFDGDNPLSIVRSLALEEPTPACNLNREVPRALSDLIAELLSKLADQRPPTAQAVVERLQSLEHELATRSLVDKSNVHSSAGDSGAGVQRRRRWAIGAAAGLCVLLPVIGLLFGAQLIRIATNKGQVIIQVDDPNVELAVRENKVVIHDRPGQAEITLAAGEHQLEVTVKQSSGEITFPTDRFTLSRGGRKIIDVHEELGRVESRTVASRAAAPRQPATGDANVASAVNPNPSNATPSDLDRRAAEWVLSLGGYATIQAPGQSKPRQILRRAALPTGAFQLKAIDFQNCKISDDGLAQLAGLANLEILDLSSTNVSDAGLAQLKALPALTGLLLRRTQVTDAGLAHLESLPRLETLSLKADHVTDAGLAHLQALKGLRILILDWTGLTDARLAQLVQLPRLECLSLRGTKVTDAGMAHVKKLTKLQSLDISRLPVTDSGLAQLEGLRQLATLNLESTSVSDSGLAHLESFKNLSNLILNHTAVTDAGLAHLKQLTNLEALQLCGTSITDVGLAQLRGLTRLETLLLHATKLTGAGLGQLEPLAKLQVLGLDELPNLSDVAVPKILHLKSLRDVTLRDSHISGKGYTILKSAFSTNVHLVWSEPNYAAAGAVLVAGGSVHIRLEGATADRTITKISDLPPESFQITRVSLTGVQKPLDDVLGLVKNPRLTALASLDLTGSTIDDTSAVRLEPFVTLRELTLAKTRITDAGLAHLKGLVGLQRLILDQAPIQGPGLIHLQTLPNLVELRLGCPTLAEMFLSELGGLGQLKRLSLAASGVSDQGIKNLEKLTRLKELDLSGTKVTAAGVQELRKALKECQITTTVAVR